MEVAGKFSLYLNANGGGDSNDRSDKPTGHANKRLSSPPPSSPVLASSLLPKIAII